MTKLLRSFFNFCLLVSLVFGMASFAAQAESSEKQQSKVSPPKKELAQKTLFSFLLADFEYANKNHQNAIQRYFKLAQETKDPQIAQIATEASLSVREYNAALQSARLWEKLSPNHPDANYLIAMLLQLTQQTEASVLHLDHSLSVAGNDLPMMLLKVPGTYYQAISPLTLLDYVEFLSAPYPELAETHYIRALALSDAKRHRQATRAINQSLAIKPGWQPAFLLKATFLPAESAIPEVKKFLKQHPDASKVRNLYTELLIQTSQYRKALTQYEHLLRKTPVKEIALYRAGVLALKINQTKKARQFLERVSDLNERHASIARLLLGELSENQQQPAKALKWYRKVQPEAAEFFTTRLRMVKLAEQQKQYTHALRILKKTPTNSSEEALIKKKLMAFLYRKSNQYSKAITILKSLNDDQKDLSLSYEIAILELERGNIVAGESRLRRIIKKAPDYAHAYNALGYSLATRKVKLKEAQKLLNTALKLSPNDPHILDSKGFLLYQLKKLRKAAYYLKRANSALSNPLIAAHYAMVLFDLGKRDQALSILEKARKQHPDSPELNKMIQELTKKLKESKS